MVRRFATIAVASLLFALCVAARGSAQEATRADAGAPAHISFVEGVAVLERDGRTDDAPANMPLLAGDRVRTRAGRVEILFADGSTLHLDHNTAIDLQSDELVRLLDGRMRLSIPGRARDVGYRIDGPHAWAQISEPGEYRAAVIQNAGQTELEFAVLRGAAELMNEGGRTPLRAGERAFARANAAPSYAYVFNSASSDPFDRWSEGRRSERLGLSTQYLPEEVRPYAGTMDRYGAWQYESSYGYVWYPRVDYGWRPYYQGRWTTLRPYGWTWIGSDPWAWPTHHYGRWGQSSGVWFWIPGRAWSPAWVSWAYAPGYVSWCPLGWNNRPVVQIVNGNVHRGYDPWRAWTVIPQRDFGVGYVHRRVITSAVIDDRTRSSFAYRDSAPVVTGHAVPRGAAPAPIRVAGTAGARRGVSPLLSNRGPATAETYHPSAPARSLDREDITRRPSSATSRDGGTGATGARERATPDRPLIRSDRGERNVRTGDPTRQSDAPRTDPRIRSYDPSARPGATPPEIRRVPEVGRDLPAYRSGGAAHEPSERRATPRGEYGGPARESSPAPRADRPSYGAPGAHERRQPVAERPAPPSAQPARPARPERSGPPPSAAPPPGGRGRPSGGDTPSRGTAVRRPGGGN